MSSPAAARPRSNASLPGSTVTPPAMPVLVPLVIAAGAAVATVAFVYGPYGVARPFDRAGLASDGALVTVVLAPLVSLLVAPWAATWAWLSWAQLRPVQRGVLLVAAVVAAAVVAYHFSPDGRDVARWALD